MWLRSESTAYIFKRISNAHGCYHWKSPNKVQLFKRAFPNVIFAFLAVLIETPFNRKITKLQRWRADSQVAQHTQLADKILYKPAEYLQLSTQVQGNAHTHRVTQLKACMHSLAATRIPTIQSASVPPSVIYDNPPTQTMKRRRGIYRSRNEGLTGKIRLRVTSRTPLGENKTRKKERENETHASQASTVGVQKNGSRGTFGECPLISFYDLRLPLTAKGFCSTRITAASAKSWTSKIAIKRLPLA